MLIHTSFTKTDNKIIMKLLKFHFPWLLTSIHALLSCTGSFLLVRNLKNTALKKPSLPMPASMSYPKQHQEDPDSPKAPASPTYRYFPYFVNRDAVILVLFSVLYTVNIAVSNISLSMVSLPFHQIVRSTNPAVTIVFERVFLKKRVKYRETYLSLLMVS